MLRKFFYCYVFFINTQIYMFLGCDEILSMRCRVVNCSDVYNFVYNVVTIAPWH